MTLFQSRYAGKAQALAAALLWSSAGLLIRGVDCGMLWLLAIRNGAAGLALSLWKQAWSASLCYALFMMAFLQCLPAGWALRLQWQDSIRRLCSYTCTRQRGKS